MTGSSALPRRFVIGAKEILAEGFKTDEKSREAVSRDWSIYRILPQAVCRPADEQELLRLTALAAEERVPLTLRGGGSGTGGAALSPSVVIELSGPFWEAEPELLEEGAFVRTRPSVSYNRIAALLAPLGRTIPADPSSAAISTIGGNIATRASGPHALRHGSMDRYLHSLTIIPGTAERIDTAHRDSHLAAGLQERSARLSDAVRRRIADHENLKSASGPRLLSLLEAPGEPGTLTSLCCGSLGAFATVTEAVIRTTPLAPERSVILHAAASDAEAVEMVARLGGGDTLAIELIDSVSLRIGAQKQLREAGLLTGEQERRLRSNGAHLLIHETERPEAVAMHQGQSPLADAGAQRLWQIRKGMLWRMGRLNRRFKAYSVINDLAVPRQRLGELIAGVREIAREIALPLPFYGHAGDANLHFRPLFRTDAPDLEAKLRHLAEGSYRLVTSLGGTVTGEHGLGPLRTPFLELEWGTEGVELFRSLKGLFDPQGILNPEALLPRRDILEHFDPR